MKTVLEDANSGCVECHEVPPPELRGRGLLVQVHYSAISAGTEKAKLQTGQQSLMGKALSRPDLVRQVVDFARDKGFQAAYRKVKTRLNTLTPLGYSCSGTVLATSPDAHEFRIGDRVACAGVGYANHAEINFVPRNLAVAVPASVDLASASLTTIGAIAMQGLRQAQVTFGETVVVIGAGLVGVLTIMLARAAGLRVIAVDRNPQRAQAALKFGAQLALCSEDASSQTKVQEFTRFGADACLITAATSSAEPLQLAASLARDRARLVVVGDVGMGVARRELYNKELSVVLSRSYGPGRYDPAYEEGGQDYPIGYVRWTEQRNMQAFLELAGSRAMDLSALAGHKFIVDRVNEAYSHLTNSDAYTVILEYPAARGEAQPIPLASQASKISVLSEPGTVAVGCVGPGSFAREVLLPALRDMKQVRLASVASSSGLTAHTSQREFGFAHCLTPTELMRQSGLDLVVISSRHDSHASLVMEALKQRKAVFVEKPLATTPEQLDAVRTTYEDLSLQGERPFVMVGFNRRFAPFTQELQALFADRTEPMALNIRVNAGFIPSSHWTQQAEGAGRIVGEFCHFLDWARFVVGHPITHTTAAALPDIGKYQRDNVCAMLTFADGSVATLSYLANGNKSLPKERYEVFCGGRVAQLEDFKELALLDGKKTRKLRSRQDKGHRRELELTIEALLSQSPSPIPFHEIAEVTHTAFAIQEAIASGATAPHTDQAVAV